MTDARKIVVDSSKLTNNSLIVYRSDKTSDTISGTNISFSIIDGSLVISSGSTPVYAFSPTQWLTVNESPV